MKQAYTLHACNFKSILESNLLCTRFFKELDNPYENIYACKKIFQGSAQRRH